jgi:rare lipoprotein A
VTEVTGRISGTGDIAGVRTSPSSGRDRFWTALFLAAGLAVAVGCAHPSPPASPLPVNGLAPYRVAGQRYVPLRDWHGYEATGIASWYGAWHHGRKTANGERFDAESGFTAAHKTLPFNVCAAVDNLATGRSVVVRINDRGPFVRNRLIDLSPAAATELGLLRKGLGTVRITALGVADATRGCAHWTTPTRSAA